MTYFKRHDDDEIIDDVSIKIVPRYKESYLSGDEWRISAIVELKRKGEVLFSRSYSDIDTAAAHLPWLLKTWTESLDSEQNKIWIDSVNKQKLFCHQPGCSNKSTVIYKLKKQFSREGFSEQTDKCFRSFCDEHSVRGDCGLEDSDSNYIRII